MAGLIDFESGGANLARAKARIAVFRRLGPGNYQFLPNVIARSIQYREGPNPGAALFRYTADGHGSAGYPVRFEDSIPLLSTNAHVVRNDDEICVAAFDPWGDVRWLFHGFAQVPQADLGPGAESVTFQAQGVAVREWDIPLGGAIVREGDHAEDADSDIRTGLPARFNPDGLPNATPAGADSDLGDSFMAPVFLDSLLCKSRDIGRKWNLSRAARYIIGAGCTRERVKVPTWFELDALLDALKPHEGQLFDPEDPATYDGEPIIVRDQVVTGKPWPEALWDLIRPHGFGMRFELSTDVDGDPETRLVLWRKDSGDGKRYRKLFLQEPGADVDPASTNLTSARVQRDGSRIKNAISVETALARYEASFILSPGFEIAAGDVADKADFIRSKNPDFESVRDAYRVWVFDEAGDGHWDLGLASWVEGEATDLSPILGGEDRDDTRWVVRRRPGVRTLLTRAADGTPLQATLEGSTDYSGGTPGLWDHNASGTWYPVKGEWSLLKDRLGIRLEGDNPNALVVGSKAADSSQKAASQVYRLVEWLAGDPQTKVYFRLTCVIEGDQRGECLADKRAASPTRFTVRHVVDAGDRYKVDAVTTRSRFGSADGAVLVRDDLHDALADAYGRRAAQEIPHLAGTWTIPRITLAYQIGDRLTEVAGRAADLQTNVGTGQGEAPAYPEVIGVDYALDERQTTTLLTSDRRGDRIR